LLDRRVVGAVPRLRFFACPDCETVYAEVDPPEDCRRCGSPTVDELRVDSQAAYFSPTETR